jgi:predicted Rossmann fold nucleotide-binding protein DprA/Smf involved in DNA uptake
MRRIGRFSFELGESVTEKAKRKMDVLTLQSSQLHWASRITERLQKSAPSCLWTIGNRKIFALRKVGLFCSLKCPENKIASAHDAAQELCEREAAIVSGFHSPVEKDCPRILLQGKQSVIICLARALGKIRLSGEWQPALDEGRLLLLSRFEKARRADKETARRRNELVLALSDEVIIIHAEPAGHIAEISQLADQWNIPRSNL